MDHARLNELLQQWTRVEDIQLLATVFFVETNGDARKLQARFDKEETIYGQIASNVLGENDALHRFLLFNIWSSNKGNIRECFASVARENGKRKKIRTTPYMGKENAEETLCWCEFSTEASIAQGLETIICSICKGHFHTLCAGLTQDYMDKTVSFVCIECAKTPKVPNLFKEASRRKGLLKGRELFPESPSEKHRSQDNMEQSPSRKNENTKSEVELRSQRVPEGSVDIEDFTRRSPEARDYEEESNCSISEYNESDLGGSRASSLSNISDMGYPDVDLPSNPHSEEEDEPNKNSKKETAKKPSFSKKEAKNKTKNDKDFENDSIDRPKERPLEIDVSNIPSTWNIQFRRKDWKKVVKKNKISGSYETPSDYGDYLQTPFSETNPVCVLKMNKRIIIEDDESKTFFTAYCLCTGEHCQAHYIFRLESIPHRGDEIHVNVTHSSGRIRHFTGEKNKRCLQGRKRVEAKELLRHDLASNVLRKKYAKADMNKITKGNIDDVKNLHIFQVAKNEVAKEGDLHPHVIVDLLLTKHQFDETYKRTKVSGFIQSISLFPFIVIMYSEESLQLLRKLTARQSINIFMDATSSIVSSLPKPFDSRKIFYYAVIVNSPTNKPVPILEFYTSQQDAYAIMYCLENFLYRYKRLYDIKSFNYRINRLEIDFSLASLYAATRVFVGQDIDQYMDSLWETILGGQKEIKFVIHICRIHVIRFLKFKIAELYRGKNLEKERKTLMRLMYRFVSSKTMSQMCGTLEDILVLVCSKYVTPETEAVLKSLDDNLPGKLNNDWKKYATTVDKKNAAFYLRCPFGGFVNSMAEEIERENAAATSDGKSKLNTYCSEKMTEYVCLHVGPCSPLMTKIPFILAKLAIADDHNNRVENFMKITKNDILQKERYQRLTRAIRKQVENSIGSVREALSSFHLDPNETPSQTSKGEFVKKREKLDKKGVKTSPSKSQDLFKTERGPRLNPNAKLLEDMDLIPWGGRSGSTSFSNTCSFDCVLQALYYFYTYTSYGKQFIDQQICKMEKSNDEFPMNSILSLLSERRYNEAKSIWITEFLDKTLDGGNLDLFEEERFYGLAPLKGWFPLKVTVQCPNSNCKKNKSKIKVRESTYISPKDQADFLELMLSGKDDECNKCNHPFSNTSYGPVEAHNYDLFAYSQIGFQRTYSENPHYNQHNPNSSKYFVSNQGPSSKEEDLKEFVDALGYKFQVVCYSMYNGRHYVLIIIQGKHRYLYDGLQANKGLLNWKDVPKSERNSYGITTVWMKRINN